MTMIMMTAARLLATIDACVYIVGCVLQSGASV